MNRFSRFALLSICAAFVALPGRAEEMPLAEIFAKVENTGSFTKSSEGGLGRDLWRGMKRSEINELLAAMPAASPEPPVQNLIYGVLLTTADTDGIENDIELKPGEDLLTLRLEKLLEGGAYHRAFELYSQLKEEPYHPRLGRAGILAMLYSGEKSLGCLEAHTAKDSFAADNFWTEITAYCDVTLNEAPQEGDIAVLEQSARKILLPIATEKSYRFAYTPEAFSALTPMEQALLTAENKILVEGLEIEKIPPAHLQALLRSPELTPEQHFALTARAVHWGLARPDDMKNEYLQLSAPAAGTEGKAAADSAQEQLAALYGTITADPESEHQWANLRLVLEMQKNIGSAALTPFAPFLSKATPVGATLAELAAAYSIMYRGDLDIPAAWQDALAGVSDQDIDYDTFSRLLATACLENSPCSATSENAALQQALEKSKPETKLLVENIIENVDKSTADNDNADSVYEKELRLTFTRDYVMPSVTVWDRAKKAAQSKALGETILLNTVLLRDLTLQNIYPGVIRDVMRGLNNVGLKDTSGDMAIAALLGGIEDTI